MDTKRLFKQLDEAESRLLSKYDNWLNQAIKSIPWPEYERIRRSGTLDAINRAPPLQFNVGRLAKILSDHATEMLTAGQAHAKLLVNELHETYRGRRLTDYPGFDFNYEDDPRVLPEKAMKAMETRAVVLAGDVDGKLLAGVKRIMIKFMAGDSRSDAEQALEVLLQSNRERAVMVTTTETTYSYNRGRLIGFKENRVDYVRFSAVMDARTSPVCRSRHGLIMKLDDPNVSYSTPPLHVKCRSVLDPVYSRYQPELLTDKNLDWSHAIPLAKGWNTS